MERNPGNQVRLNALDLNKVLNKKLGRKIWVTGIVSLINNNFEVIKKPRYYSIVSVGDLTRFILNNDKKIRKKTVSSIVYLMQDYCTEVYYKKEDVEIE